MTRALYSLGLGLGLVSALTLTGCGSGGEAPSPPAAAEADHDHGDHDHDGHDHGEDDHAGHDHSAHEHPAHGLNGGHVVKLDNGSEIEVALDKENDAFSIFPADAKTVKSIKMISKIEEAETTYDFTAAAEAEMEGAFVLTSPELATAVRMGDAVEVTLVVETEQGATSTRYQHHEH